MHATGKSSTVGVSAIVLASFLYFSASEAGTSIKELLTIVFVFLGGPGGAYDRPCRIPLTGAVT